MHLQGNMRAWMPVLECGHLSARLRGRMRMPQQVHQQRGTRGAGSRIVGLPPYCQAAHSSPRHLCRRGSRRVQAVLEAPPAPISRRVAGLQRRGMGRAVGSGASGSASCGGGAQGTLKCTPRPNGSESSLRPRRRARNCTSAGRSHMRRKCAHRRSGERGGCCAGRGCCGRRGCCARRARPSLRTIRLTDPS